MIRLAPLSLILAIASGCAGDDDGGGGDGPGGASCEGSVTGGVAGGFSDCVAAINHYPDGAFDVNEENWIFSLVAAPEAGAELDPPLESIGINLVIAGAPAAGSYTLADALPTTAAFLYAPAADGFEVEEALSLEVAGLEKVSEMDVGGVATISYTLSGSFEMTLARGDGDTATVNAAF